MPYNMAERKIIMTTMKIQNESTIQSIGKKRTKNAKPVLCIETGKVYNSIIDAAEDHGVTSNAVGRHIRGLSKTCNGKHFAFVSKANESLDPIMTHIRVQSEYLAEIEYKAKAYDAIMAEKYAREKKQERIDMLLVKKEERVEKMRRREERIQRDAELIMEIDAEIKALQEELSA
jgi:hypothetical protein